MAGNTNFPTTLDDDTSLYDVTDGVTALDDAHHNNLKEAIKALEAKVGVYSTSAPTTLDYRLGNPTNSHRHDGASGQGRNINATTITYSDGLLLTDSMRRTLSIRQVGSLSVGSNLAAPQVLGRTQIIENVSAALRRGPSGATTSVIVRVGPTAIFGASVGLAVRFAPGATRYGQPSTNLTTYPSGALITIDADAVGSNDPGQDLSVTFVLRD